MPNRPAVAAAGAERNHADDTVRRDENRGRRIIRIAERSNGDGEVACAVLRRSTISMGMVKMLQTFSTMLIAKFCSWLMLWAIPVVRFAWFSLFT